MSIVERPITDIKPSRFGTAKRWRRGGGVPVPGGESVTETGEADFGPFGPKSVVWKVITTPGPACLRAYTSGALELRHRAIVSTVLDHDPLMKGARAGVVTPDMLFSRIQRTSGLSTQALLGDTETVTKVANHLRAWHVRFTGQLLGGGGEYNANSPENALFAHVTAAHGMLRLYEATAFRDGRLPHRLGADERDRYWAEFKPWAVLVGANPEDVPTSVAEVAEYYANLPEGTYFELDTLPADAKQRFEDEYKRLNTAVRKNIKLSDVPLLLVLSSSLYTQVFARAVSPRPARRRLGLAKRWDLPLDFVRYASVPLWAVAQIPAVERQLIRVFWGPDGLGLYVKAQARVRAARSRQ